MKRLLNLGLLLGFLCCYLEWPPDNASFIFEAEYEIIAKTQNWGSNFTHPVILAAFLSQLILLYCALKKNAGKKLNHFGVILHGVVVLLFLLVGLLAGNWKIVLSTVPYLVLAVVYFWKSK